MKIDLYYFDDCPSWKQALENLQLALASERINPEINLIRIESDEDAAREKFLGSPSIRVNGRDLWPEERQSYPLSCRIYATQDGMRGAPNPAMLAEKLRALQALEGAQSRNQAER